MTTNTKLPKNAKLLSPDEAEELLRDKERLYLDEKTGEICKQVFSFSVLPISGAELVSIGWDHGENAYLVISHAEWEKRLSLLNKKSAATQEELDAARRRRAVVEDVERVSNNDVQGLGVGVGSGTVRGGEVDDFCVCTIGADSDDHVHVDDVFPV